MWNVTLQTRLESIARATAVSSSSMGPLSSHSPRTTISPRVCRFNVFSR